MENLYAETIMPAANNVLPNEWLVQYYLADRS